MEAEDSYQTIKAKAEGIFRDKGSRFLAFAHPVSTEAEIKDLVDYYRKEYFDARHHCYAYRLGALKLQFRANDDGEPSGTAGKPILGQLQSNDLTNVLVMVVRYFGGTLLGTSGLIVAYREATADAIRNSEIVTRYVHCIYELRFGYLQMNAVMKLVKDHDLEMADQRFEMLCEMKIKIRKSISERLVEKLGAVEGVEIDFLNEE